MSIDSSISSAPSTVPKKGALAVSDLKGQQLSTVDLATPSAPILLVRLSNHLTDTYNELVGG